MVVGRARTIEVEIGLSKGWDAGTPPHGPHIVSVRDPIKPSATTARKGVEYMDPSIGEIIKITGETAPAGTLGDAWQAIIGDRVAHWRLRNAMALQKRTNEEAARLGLSLNVSRIPERYAFTWFEEATKQDEPELQELFARLLARAAAGDEDAQDRRLIQVLSGLTPVDAAIFQRIYSDKPFPGVGAYDVTRSITKPMTMDPAKKGWPRDWAEALLETFHPGQVTKSIESLILAGLLEAGEHMEGERNRGSLPVPTATRGDAVRAEWQKFIHAHAAMRPHILPTALGASLYKAVSA